MFRELGQTDVSDLNLRTSKHAYSELRHGQGLREGRSELFHFLMSECDFGRNHIAAPPGWGVLAGRQQGFTEEVPGY